jgi:integrase
MPKQPTTNSNPRMLHKYLVMMRHARGRSETTITQIAASIADFEAFVGKKDFRKFKPGWAINYKAELNSRISKSTGYKLSVHTIVSRLRHLMGYFVWLSQQPGYRSRINYSDVQYFSPTLQNRWSVKTGKRAQIPTLEQARHIVLSMPAHTDIELRNRALIAFILLTGSRADAAASFSLGNLDVEAGTAFFDGGTSRTKNRKSYTADFFPVGDDVAEIVIDWERHLRVEKLFAASDPLFPATRTVRGKKTVFEACGLSREFWNSSEPIRRTFRQGCESANLAYFHPHSFRETLGHLIEKICRTPEEFKAASQSLGHESVDTTFRNYGAVSETRQAEIMKQLRERKAAAPETGL